MVCIFISKLFSISVNFTNRHDVFRTHRPVCSTTDAGWYYYDFESGTMTGLDDLAGASLKLAKDQERGAFQIGNGATQVRGDKTIFGMMGWFR